MGFEPFLVGSAITGVMNQRLARQLCPACRRRVEPRTQFAQKHDIKTCWVADGCDQCANSGVAGRIPVTAILAADDQWCDLVAKCPSLVQLRREAAKSPLGTLNQAVVSNLREGHISEDEAMAILNLGDFDPTDLSERS